MYVRFLELPPLSCAVRLSLLLRTSPSEIAASTSRRLTMQVPIPPPGDGAPPAFVAGGTDDWIVDVEGVRELAAWCGVEPRVFPRIAHDMMLVSVLTDHNVSALQTQSLCALHLAVDGQKRRCKVMALPCSR